MATTSTTLQTYSSPRSSFVITEEQYKELLQFTQSPEYRARFNRVAAWVEDDEFRWLLLRIGGVGVGTIITIGGTGVAVGAAAGPEGALIGGLTGVAIALIITTAYGHVEASKHYNNWLKAFEHKRIMEGFNQLRESHPGLQEYTDAITQSPFIDPVLTPCEHLFERAQILKWLEKNVTCPLCRAAVSKKALVTDYVLIGKLKKLYGEIAKKEAENPIYPKDIKDALIQLSQASEAQAKQILVNSSTQLTLQLTSNKITPELFAKKMREVLELYPDEHQRMGEFEEKKSRQLSESSGESSREVPKLTMSTSLPDFPVERENKKSNQSLHRSSIPLPAIEEKGSNDPLQRSRKAHRHGESRRGEGRIQITSKKKK